MRADRNYIFELIFSAFQIGNKNIEERTKYSMIYKTSGDENLVLCYISDEV